MLDNTTKLELSKSYSLLKDRYIKLGINLIQALQLFLNENDINFLSINYRIKDENSFIEKVERKVYMNPFDQTEDLCGIRIICYYQSDVSRIISVLEKELDILDNQDKEVLLNEDQFGYRSTHLIVKIKKNWLNAPNYRGLEDMKAEIQIRTVLMHAWAEIEHKLAYKKDIHIPKEFKRKLNRISAKLEEADEQFEDVKIAIIDYKRQVIEKSKSNTSAYKKIDLNLDSLQAFLDDKFIDRSKDIELTRELLDELIENNVTLTDLSDAYEVINPYISEIEIEEFAKVNLHGLKWTQIGVVRKIMDIANPKYRINRMSNDQEDPFSAKWRNIIYT